MTQQRKAQLVTIALIVVVLVAVVIRRSGWSPASFRPQVRETTPQDAVYAMLDAARAGDVDAYLGFFTGQLRESLEQALREQGKQAFAEYLRQANAPIKGIAIAEAESLHPRAVRLRVEYVYADRNEVQYMDLEKIDGRWRITRLSEAQRVKTIIPYGTPVE